VGTGSRRALLGIGLLALAVLALRLPSRQQPAQQPPPSRVEHRAVGFESHEKLVAHYRKHGAEFGGISQEEYLRLAQNLRDRPAGNGVLESVREDRVVTRFDRASGAFLAANPDLTIRTFFKPNDGEAYFVRQGRRGAR
jgi:pyocin large subunit-like protein